jgi:hypothetical protein
MAEPSSAKTFYDLILAVAKQLHIADYRSNGTTIVPTDQFSFELCKDVVNDGVEMFIADAPRKGWRWMRRLVTLALAVTYTGTASSGSSTTLVDSGIADSYADDFFNGYDIYIEAGTGVGESATITDYTGASGTFTFAALSGGSTPDSTSEYSIAKSTSAINGDGSRYTLPANFGGTADGKIDFVKGSNLGHGIEWCDESFLRSRRAGTVNTGHPMFAAILPYQPTSETLAATRLWEIMFDPRPSSIKTISFPYTLHFDKMRMEMGTATGGSATTLVDSERWEVDDFFNDWIITVRSGTGRGETATVTDYTGSSGTFAFTALSGGSTPDTTTVYTVEPASNLHPAGHQFDDTIVSACKAKAEMDEQDEHMDTAWTEMYHKKALPNAYRLDGRSVPRKLGSMNRDVTRHRTRLGDSANFSYLDSDGSSVVQ